MGRKRCTALSELLRSRREMLGLSELDLSRRTGIAIQWVRELETGRQKRIQQGTARRLADALNLDISLFKNFVGSTRSKILSASGRLIRSRRNELCLSQEELAEKLAITKSYLSRLEICGVRRPHPNLVRKLREVLAIEILPR